MVTSNQDTRIETKGSAVYRKMLEMTGSLFTQGCETEIRNQKMAMKRFCTKKKKYIQGGAKGRFTVMSTGNGVHSYTFIYSLLYYLLVLQL